MTIFETDRLRLRRLEMGDLVRLAGLYGDPEIRRYFPDGTRTWEETREELEWFLHGHPRRPELGLWAMILKSDGSFVGRSGLLTWQIDGREEIEIAYLVAREYWGRGLGAEVAQGLVRHGFETLGLRRLIALIDPEHEASKRTAQRAGLRYERQIVMEGLPTQVFAIENRGAQGPESDRSGVEKFD